jgi:hypothetical protein
MDRKTFIVGGICATGMAFLAESILADNKVTTPFYAVQSGQAKSVIVIAASASLLIQNAATNLQYHIQRASGVNLQIVTDDQLDSIPAGFARFAVGPSKLTQALQIPSDDLEPEKFRLQTKGNTLAFIGHDVPVQLTRIKYATPNSAATFWAVDYFLDRYLGVRWLWPGEVGTYVPANSTIALPEINITAQPKLEQRTLLTRFQILRHDAKTVRDEPEHQLLEEQALAWLDHHQMGDRSNIDFQHSFGDWWDKYHEAHPEYFAMSPDGKREPRNEVGKTAKLCVGNPAIDDAIIAEWKAAGAPDKWKISPNDGVGFCTDPLCRALDEPSNQDINAIWMGQTNLTARYVKFWNRLQKKMRIINPKVRLEVLAYSAYRNAPPADVPVPDGLIIALVPAYWQYEVWNGWAARGASIILRPNWWHVGAVAPNLPLHRMGAFFQNGMMRGMFGFFFDILLGYWGTQGTEYYLIARLSERPDLSIDEILDEYCSAFGNAAPEIQKYLQYWENYTERCAFPTVAGGVVDQDHAGLFAEAVQKYNFSLNPRPGCWQTLPVLYSDEILSPAYAILDQAEKKVGTESTFTQQRIAFLRDGLDQLKLTRDVIQMAYPQLLPASMTGAEAQKQHQELAEKLQEMRREMGPKNVLWPDISQYFEKVLHIPTQPKSDVNNAKEPDLAGK